MPFPFIIKAGREIGKEKSGRPYEEILQGRSRREDRQDTLIFDLFAPPEDLALEPSLPFLACHVSIRSPPLP